jgi:raffinose/stachyose/melibiose transport system substrate-binding protein
MRLRKGVGSALVISLIFISLLAGYIGYNKIEINNKVNSFGTNDSKSKITSNKNQPVKIKLGIWESKTDIAFWTEKVKEYTAIKPNVTVEVETIPDNSGQYLKVRLAANDLPDLFYLKPGHLTIYKDSLLSLDELKATSRNRYPAELDGHILGLPLVSFSEYVYYHPSIFQEVGVEVPQTYDEFMNVLEKIKAHGKYIPIAIGGKDDWTFYPFIEFGPPVLTEDERYLANLANIKRPFGAGSAFEKAANMLKSISEKKLAGEDALAIGFDQATQLFQSDKAAMIALGQWYYSEHMSKVNTDEDIDAFALPWRSTIKEKLQAVTMPDQYMAINKNSKNTEESIAFLEWMFSPEVYQPYINNSQNSSTLNDVTANLPFFNKVNNLHPFNPFMYQGLDEQFVKIKNAAQYDEKKMAQEIFAGASVADIVSKMNENWSKAVEYVESNNIHFPLYFDK